MLRFPNAKINIGLYVTDKRQDGFHNIETIFYPIAYYDGLEIISSDLFSFQSFGLDIDGHPDNNLIVKAYQLLLQDFPTKVKPISVALLKNIPMGAGLGGGSADAAMMLCMLNEFFNLQLPDEALKKYALRLGSDCPFFIDNQPALGRGRGELLEPISLSLKNYSLVLVKPPIHISTQLAFESIKPSTTSMDLKNKISLPIQNGKITSTMTLK
jgi:4-diphosphocytidyl-2-C-methyl-D-erythritol kinase (EC 2.7.1.148)